jgi:hypothetical protein
MFAGGSRLGDPGPMDLKKAARSWHTHGFVILPEFIPADELQSAVGELDLLFPSSEGFHDGTDPRRERFIGDEFAGIDTFPFASTEISLLAVNHRILALAEASGTACTWASGRPASSGDSGWAGRHGVSNANGSTSSAAPPRASSRPSGSRRLDILTGRRRRWPGWRCGIRNSTSRPGARLARNVPVPSGRHPRRPASQHLTAPSNVNQTPRPKNSTTRSSLVHTLNHRGQLPHVD